MILELLEREAQLGELEAALEPIANGEGVVAIVRGEAGIGKTSLIEHFVRGQEDSFRILWGSCDALITPRPLGPLHDMSSQLNGDGLALGDPDAKPIEVFSAFLRELQNQASIAVFEDVHWADEATLDLLKYLGRRINGTQTLLVMTYRDDEVGPRHPLRHVLGDLATQHSTRHIKIPPLSKDAVSRLVGERELDPDQLHRQTGGNPFYVTEVLESGAQGIPPTVRDAVLARAARLSKSGRAVLEAAAVIGLRVEPRLLEQVVQAEATSVEECMEVGMLFSRDEALSFRHDLTRQAILEAITPQRKTVLHRLVLEALESSRATRKDLARLAHHAAAADDREAVRDYAPAAAREAAAAGAHRQAAAQYALALRFPENHSPAERATLLEAYATECTVIDQWPKGIAARQEAVELWRAAGNTAKQGENLAEMTLEVYAIGQTERAEQLSQEAIQILKAIEPGRELALAYRQQGHLRMLNLDVEEAITWAQKAIELLERFNDPGLLAHATNTLGTSELFLDYTRGCATLERSLATSRKARLDAHVVNAFVNLGSGSGELYQFRQAEGYLREGMAFSAERGMDSSLSYMQAWLALTYFRQGRWNRAAKEATMVLQRPVTAPRSKILALLAIGFLRARRGDPGVSDALDEALELAEETIQLEHIWPVRAARAEAAWLRAAYDLAVGKKHPWYTGEVSLWLWRAGEEVSLPAWVAAPYARQIRGDSQEAAEEWERLGCPYERAMALMDGDVAAQNQALEIFEALGAGPAAEMAREKLSAVPQRQLEKEMFGGLTAREREVAALIAQGKSNREIAESLVVKEKTVETYVTRILSKLAYESRVQIATWALDVRLVEGGSRDLPGGD